MDGEKSGCENRIDGDGLIRALAAEDTVRIIAVSGKNLVSEARRIHDLSRVATAALGRQLMMTAIMAGELKNETDRVSTIIKGDGPGGSMVVTGTPGLDVKGTIQNPNVELAPNAKGKLDVSGLVGSNGRLTVVRDFSMKEPYVGSSQLKSGEIAEDFAQYYAVSQQQPSMVYLGVRVGAKAGEVRAAGGILVQPLPGCPEETVDKLAALAENIQKLALRLENGESLGNILSDIFRELEMRIVFTGVPHYHCDCSRERIEQALISVGKEELQDMIRQDHGAEVQCHFCNKKYQFSEAQLTELLWRATGGEHEGN